MSLNESLVEEAALTWFYLRQGYGGQVGELKFNGYGRHPPDLQDAAVQTVLQQAGLLCADWAN